MPGETHFLTGFHGIRPPVEVSFDRDGWLAWCRHCLENGQEGIVGSALETEQAAEDKAADHQYRHASCDPRHIQQILSLYGGPDGLTETEICQRSRLDGREPYLSWLLRAMHERGVLELRGGPERWTWGLA